MAERSVPVNLALGRLLVWHDIGLLEQRSTPDPDRARATLRLARLIELHDDEPNPSVKWLVRYLDACTATGAR